MLKNAIKSLASVCAAHWETHSSRGKIWLFMGVVGLIVDAALCYQYGVTQTTWHGIGFALVALFFSQLPDGAYAEWESGRKLTSLVLWAMCVPLGMVAYQSHIGYGAGVRKGDMQQATVQNSKWDDARKTATENADNLAMWKDQLSKLQSENAWSATVTADGLRAQVANMEGDRVFKRSKACANVTIKESREFCDKLTATRERVATVERVTDLTGRIEATQRLVEKARLASAETKVGTSSSKMQADANMEMAGLLKAWWTGEDVATAINGDDTQARVTNIAITALGSLAFMLMAPIGFFMAGRNRVHGIITHPVETGAVHAAPMARQSTSRLRVTEIPMSQLVAMPDEVMAAA